MPKTETKNPFEVSRITLVSKDSLKAMVVVKLADTMFLTGIRVIESKRGLFVSMPTRRTPQGEYEDIFFSAGLEKRRLLSTTVLEAYERERRAQGGA